MKPASSNYRVHRSSRILNTTPTVSSVKYVVIETKDDDVVTPYTNASLPAASNVQNILLQNQCSEDVVIYISIAYDSNALADVVNDPGPTTRTSCPRAGRLGRSSATSDLAAAGMEALDPSVVERPPRHVVSQLAAMQRMDDSRSSATGRCTRDTEVQTRIGFRATSSAEQCVRAKSNREVGIWLRWTFARFCRLRNLPDGLPDLRRLVRLPSPALFNRSSSSARISRVRRGAQVPRLPPVDSRWRGQ